jgi:cyclopropane fatty-acyl-phospholipid synthase-like methyltransferase
MDRFKETAQRVAAHVGPRSRVLEIAPGPGYLAIELAKLTGCRMVGVDISRTFVRIANENARKLGSILRLTTVTLPTCRCRRTDSIS